MPGVSFTHDCDIYDLFLLMIAAPAPAHPHSNHRTRRRSAHTQNKYPLIESAERTNERVNGWVSQGCIAQFLPDDMQISLIGRTAEESKRNAINNIPGKNL